MPATASKSVMQITTVRLPRRLYEEARAVVEKRSTNASSLNELVIDSLNNRLDQLRRASIDAEFVGMKNDAQYHRESSEIAEQFSSNDGDTIRRAEKAKP
jgi:hypothetical protein